MSRIAQFTSLVQAHPENELFRFSLAQALLAEQRPGDARPHLEHCVANKADWMLPRILLGKLHLAAGNPHLARPLLQTALTLALEQNHDDPAEELHALLQTLDQK